LLWCVSYALKDQLDEENIPQISQAFFAALAVHIGTYLNNTDVISLPAQGMVVLKNQVLYSLEVFIVPALGSACPSAQSSRRIDP
jgi:hypothetical protein